MSGFRTIWKESRWHLVPAFWSSLKEFWGTLVFVFWSRFKESRAFLLFRLWISLKKCWGPLVFDFWSSWKNLHDSFFFLVFKEVLKNPHHIFYFGFEVVWRISGTTIFVLFLKRFERILETSCVWFLKSFERISWIPFVLILK